MISWTQPAQKLNLGTVIYSISIKGIDFGDSTWWIMMDNEIRNNTWQCSTILNADY